MPPERTGFADDGDTPASVGVTINTFDAFVAAPARPARRRAEESERGEAAPEDDQGFAPEPASVLDRLFEAIEARRGADPRATIQYVQTMLTTLLDIKTRTEQAVEMAALNATTAQEQLYVLHSELDVFKNNLVPHSIHAFGKVIPKVTQRSVEMQAMSLTKEQVTTGLAAIEKEFAGSRLEYSSLLNRECFIVRTHNIILSQPTASGNGLQEFDFGPFDICLDMRRFASNQNRPYFCVAVEPRVAPNRGGCAHPHVLDHVMCEGNAGDVIQKVLSRGDLYTFFVVVNQTLSVYNRHSPHVPLEKWIDGARRNQDATYCLQCEGAVSRAARAVCINCSAVGHHDCFNYCGTAGDYLCNNCREYFMANEGNSCEACDELGSDECAIRDDTTCPGCGERREHSLMTRCTVSGNTLCTTCYEQHANDRQPCCPNHNSGQCVLYTRHGVGTRMLEH